MITNVHHAQTNRTLNRNNQIASEDRLNNTAGLRKIEIISFLKKTKINFKKLLDK